jgi:amidase
MTGKPEACLSIRSLGAFPAEGEGKYMINKYLRERGDANIKSNVDLISKAKFYNDSNFPDRKQGRGNAEHATQLDTSVRLHHRFALQSIVLQCMQVQRLDAITYPTANVPSPKLNGPREPNVNKAHPSDGRCWCSRDFQR